MNITLNTAVFQALIRKRKQCVLLPYKIQVLTGTVVFSCPFTNQPPVRARISHPIFKKVGELTQNDLEKLGYRNWQLLIEELQKLDEAVTEETIITLISIYSLQESRTHWGA